MVAQVEKISLELKPIRVCCSINDFLPKGLAWIFIGVFSLQLALFLILADVFFSSLTRLNPFEVLLELNFPSLLKGVSLSFIYCKIRKNLRTMSLYQIIESENQMQSKEGLGEVR